MADIPVDYRPDRPEGDTLPAWAGWLGLAALALLIWILFSLGTSAAPQAEADTTVALLLDRTITAPA
ncbi:MAG: hypothetical protein WBG08_10915 [Litorimonas sp.]